MASSSPSKLLDLPDEMFLSILTKLNTIDVFHLKGLNKRIDNIVYDEVITNNELLDLFCLKILPDIHYKIQSLNVELSSMKPIFLTTIYPNLYKLGLYNVDANTFFFYWRVRNNNSFLNIYKNQITSFIIRFNNKSQRLLSDSLRVIFTSIFKIFTNLDYLNFTANLVDHQQISFGFSSPPSIVSMNLLKLNINVNCFNDCLYLLDGRFENLHTLCVRISRINADETTINNKKILFKLKYFSLTSDASTNVYDELIVPLIHRMLNLEKLRLYLLVVHKETFIDGNNLKYNIINYLLNLKQFGFNIHSFIPSDNPNDLPSNEDIRKSLINVGNNYSFSYINYYPESRMGHCNIYSYSCSNEMKFYYNITNNFQSEIYQFVTEISLFDEYPFEHEFFIRISQSFPFIEKTNLPIAQFIHIIALNFDDAHDDYIEQFLFDTKTCLSNNVSIMVEYYQLVRVTHNFKRPATKNNCQQCGYKYDDE
ncbi:unnamed protein product [Rotaria sordida]|uniref:F-box domain-containing protein n=1 Tax=Rotaria sordida TaxID=392033 RepID=A0A815VW39_9BILA|nr:unnamed protein product [Rotaria sordida]CAF1666682.1 unnamed protein product [Rotaria sordida]